MVNAPGTARRLRTRKPCAHLQLLIPLALLLVSALGCGGPEVPGQAEEPSATGETVGSSSHLLAEVMEADRAFARAVAEQGLEAWVEAFAEDGSMIPASGPVLSGHEAIRATMTPAFGTPGFAIVWEPLAGEVASSGDLGYTYGDYESGAPGAGRSGDGEWKVVADLGNREQSQE